MRTAVVFVSHTGIVGGAERSLLGILKGLDRDRFDATLCAPSEGALLERARGLGIAIAEIDAVSAAYAGGLSRGSWNLLDAARRARNTIRRLQPGLVHANSLRAGLVASLAVGRSVPTIWHVRDLLPPHPANRLIGTVGRLCGVRWVANSLAVATSLRTVTSSPVRVVYNGIQVERFIGDAVPWPRIPPDVFPIVGIIGQIIPWKGQLELIDAFARLITEHPGAQLWIIGSPLFREESLQYEAAIKSRMTRPDVQGKIFLFGAREDIPEALAALDILVINSTAEPFGRVILEAQAAGVPVVATRAGGAVEVVTHQTTGWLVRPGDTADMAQALITLAGDEALRQRLAQEGRAQVRTRFTNASMVDRMAAIFEETGLITGASQELTGC